MRLVPYRRTVLVLVSLVGAMTLASGLLLMLDPASSERWPDGPALWNIHRSSPGDQALFSTDRQIRSGHWRAVVVHQSGSLAGSAASIDAAHRRIGRGPLGYHFVIHNGRGGPDGQIARGPRWRHQDHGVHSVGPGGSWINQNAIGICLIGDLNRKPLSDAQLDQLVWLVQRLQERLGIGASAVYLPPDLDQRLSAQHHFPTQSVRAQLLAPAP